MVTLRRRQIALTLLTLLVPACTQHAVIEEVRVEPDLLCPCEPLRAEVLYYSSRRIDATLEPPGEGRTVLTEVMESLAVTTLLFPAVCEPAILTATAVLADPETEPATAAVNVGVLIGQELIPARAEPVCGASCTISGFAPIRFESDRFSEAIDVVEVCNRSGRRVELTSPEGRLAELAPTGCSAAFAGARLTGNWGVRAQPRISPGLREVCPDPACVTGATGPLSGVEAAPALALEFLVGCPPD